MTQTDLIEYRRAQELAFLAMGKEPRVRGTAPRWKAHDDPGAHHELTEAIFSFRRRAAQEASE